MLDFWISYGFKTFFSPIGYHSTSNFNKVFPSNTFWEKDVNFFVKLGEGSEHQCSQLLAQIFFFFFLMNMNTHSTWWNCMMANKWIPVGKL